MMRQMPKPEHPEAPERRMVVAHHLINGRHSYSKEEYVRADVHERVKAQRDVLKAAAEDAEYWLVEHDAGPATVLEELQSAISACEEKPDV